MRKIYTNKFKFIFIMMLLAVSLTACNKKEDVPEETTTTEAVTAAVEVKDTSTIQKGSLIVGIYPANNDFVNVKEDGSIEGFDIDLAKAIGELTLLDVKYVEMEHKEVYSELDVSMYDCIISAVKKDSAVDKVYDYTIPYFTDEEGNEYAILTKTGNNRLLNVLNPCINILKENGTLDSLEEKWFMKEDETLEYETENINE